MQEHARQDRLRRSKWGALAMALVLLAAVLLTVSRAQAQTPPPSDPTADEAVEDAIAIVRPAEGEVIALNGGGPENAYPLTWTRVEGAIFYRIEVYSPPILLKDGDLVLQEASKLDYIFNPDDASAFQLQNPVFMLDVGQLEPRYWHQATVTAYGPTQRFLQEYPDFRNQPTDLGLDSGYYVPLTIPSTPVNFFLAIADGDPPIPAEPPLEEFPTYEDIVVAVPDVEELPPLEEPATTGNSLFDIINSIRFGNQ